MKPASNKLPRKFNFRLRQTPTSVSPLLHEFNSIVNSTPFSFEEIGRRAGIGKNTITQWRVKGRNPSLFFFECVLESLGYELKIVKKGKSK